MKEFISKKNKSMTTQKLVNTCDVCGGELSSEDYKEIGVCRKCIHETGEVRIVNAEDVENEWPDHNEE